MSNQTAGQKRPPRRATRPVQKQKKGWMLWVSLGIALLVLAAVAMIGYPYVKKMAYPLEHESEIIKYAKMNDLDPYLVCGVIHSESKFDAEAVSKVGAVGLMQIMPDTGSWIAKKMGLEGYSEEKLKDPETNIRMGCWYLRYLSDRFDGNLINMLAAYNAGPNRVLQWLQDPQYSKNGQLTEIPYEETKNYVKKVQSAKEKYETYYKLQ